ncbi:uncharacterized protein DNG_09859 [Cephalotrichum gorgonifer]|uniref:Uncharacterized protein n=1 Tax=Cephalotrichum gorgonifer TaxID=2041049 RepID=A0AAE8N8X6_9PEZI|nr:uncharacterized protein DNG_09859 [Cephalotrichum gorgonifer]
MGKAETVPGQASRSGVPSASLEVRSPRHGALTPSPPAKDTRAGRVPSLASNATSPTEDTEPSQRSDPPARQKYPEPSVKAADNPWPSVNSSLPTRHDGDPGGPRHALWSPGGPSPGRKRAPAVAGDDERDDAGRDRRKRRATDGQSAVGPSPGRKRSFPGGSDDERDEVGRDRRKRRVTDGGRIV